MRGPAPVLRRSRPAARGPRGRGVPGRTHVIRATGTGRGGRPGDPVELPADDGDLEDRPRARGRQHDRAQAQRHHTDVDTAAGRTGRRVPSARRAQRDHRRPGHRRRAGGAPDARHGGDHRERARRNAGRQVGGRRRQARPPRIGRQGAGGRLRRRRHRRRRRGHRGGRLLQRRPGLHRGDPGARRSSGVRRLRRCPDRAGQGHRDRTAVEHRRAVRPAEQPVPTGAGRGHGGPTAGPRGGAGRWVASGRGWLLLLPHRRLGPPPGRRGDPGRDLRTGDHGAAVHLRGGGADLGQRCPLRARFLGVDVRPRHRDADVRRAQLRLRLGEHPHPASWPRCRTAASDSPDTARICRSTAWRTTPGSSTSCMRCRWPGTRRPKGDPR